MLNFQCAQCQQPLTRLSRSDKVLILHCVWLALLVKMQRSWSGHVVIDLAALVELCTVIRFCIASRLHTSAPAGSNDCIYLVGMVIQMYRSDNYD